MKKSNKKITELTEFISDTRKSIKNKKLYEVPYTIRYKLSSAISSTYDINEGIILKGISNE